MLKILQATNGFWYLAHPYTHHEPSVQDDRLNRVQTVVAYLMANGVVVYSPVTSTIHAAGEHDLPTSHDFWMKQNEAFISGSCGVLLFQLPGWQVSRGVAHELAYATSISKPILNLELDRPF